MNPKLEEHLIALYPWVKPVKSPNDRAFRFECGDGWYPLLVDMLNEIEDAHRRDSHGMALQVAYVKEKFGTLRLSMGFIRSPEIQQIVDSYEKLSARTCEGCGKEHNLHWRGGWATTKCDECVESELKCLKDR
jgi:hypothetical protein